MVDQVRVDINYSSNVTEGSRRDAEALRAQVAALNDLNTAQAAFGGGFEDRIASAQSRIEALTDKLRVAGQEVRLLNAEWSKFAEQRPPPAPPQFPAPSTRIYDPSVSQSTLSGVTRELEQQVSVTRQLGDTASAFEGIRNAQLNTRLGMLAAENAAERRNWSERQAASSRLINDMQRENTERMKFAQQMAPRESIASHQQFLKDIFDMETANNVRIASARRAASAEVIRQMRNELAERRAAEAGALDFASRMATATGRASAVRYTGSTAAHDLRAIRDEGQRLEHGLGGNSRVISHAFGMMDSAARGARGAFFSSFGAMIRDSGLFAAALQAVGYAGLGMGVGLLALGAGAGVVAYRLAEDENAIKNTAGALSLMGQAFTQSRADVKAWYDQIYYALSITWGQARSAVEALGAIPHTTQEMRTQLAELAQTVSTQTGMDLTKTFGEFGKAAREGVPGIEKLAESIGAQLDPQVIATATAMQKSGDTFNALKVIVTELQAVLGDASAWQKQENAAAGFARRMGMLFDRELGIVATEEGGGLGVMLGQQRGTVPIPPKPEVTTSRAPRPQEDVEAINAAKTATTQLLSEETKRVQLQKDLNNLEREEAILRETLATSGDVADAEQAGNRLKTNLETQAEARARLANIHTEAEQREYRSTLNRIAAQEVLYQHDAQKALEFEEEKYKAAVQFAAEPLRRQNLPEEEIQRRVAVDPGVEAAQRSLTAAQDQAERQRLEIIISNNRAIANEENQGGKERVAKQLENLQIMRDNERLFGQVAINQQLQLVRTTQRQAANQAFQEERERTRIAVDDAKGHADAIDRIRKAYDNLREAAARTGQLPAMDLQIYRDQLRDVIAARNEAFSGITEALSADQRLASMRTKAFEASQRAMVDSHQISRAQMESAVASFQGTEMAAEEQKVEAVLNNNNLNERERQKLNERLAELYAQDAANHEQAQERITRAIEQENDRRIKSFTSMFDTVGSGIERFFTEGLTRSTTRGQALQELGRTITGAVVKQVGNLASEYAGKQLGPALGLTEEQSKGGLGEVFGAALAKSLGLLKDTPKDQQAAAAALYQKAAEAQQKASDGFKTAVDKFGDAVSEQKRIQEKVDAIERNPAQKAADIQEKAATTQEKAADKFAGAVDKFVGGIDKDKTVGETAGGTPHGPMSIPAIRPGAPQMSVPVAPPQFSTPRSASDADYIEPPPRTSSSVPIRTQTPRGPMSLPGAQMSVPVAPPSVRDVAAATSAPDVRSMQAWLSEHGYTSQAAAGVIGNAQIEAPGLNPAARGKAGELGLFQFHPASMLPQYEAFAALSNRSSTDWRAQMEFMDQQLQKLDPTFKKTADSAGDMAERFDRNFERPKNIGATLEARRRAAEAAFGGSASPNITDVSPQLGFGDKFGQLQNVQGFIIHHTGGGSNVDQVINTFKERNLASQFVIDRQGGIFRTLPEGAKGQHIIQGSGLGEGLSNSNTLGVEVIAKNDADVLRSQVEAAKRLVSYESSRYGFDPRTQVFGHGEVNPGHKEATEGLTIANAIREGNQPTQESNRQLSDNVRQLSLTSGQQVSVGQQDKTATDSQRQAVNDNTEALRQQNQKNSTTGSSGSTGGGTTTSSGSTGSLGSSLGLLTQGLGIAASGASVFGRQLSTQSRTVLGAVGVMSQLIGFTKNLGSTFDIFGSTTKAASTVTSALQLANTGNTVATTANTLATTANSAAEQASAAGSAAGGAAKGIGGLFSLFFEHGGIVPSASSGMMVGTSVPSAAGGMIVPAQALSGGGQLSILHPREMVLPARISDVVLNAANGAMTSANASISDARRMGFNPIESPAQVTHNNANSSMSYAPQITGRFGTMSRGELSSILRTHGDMFESMARNMVRNNNGLFRG